MFVATFVGHQGWSVATQSTHVLVDPLLTEGFGHGGDVGRVYPPRALDLAAWPPVDAVFLTHEHDDHFDIPSLQRLGRRIPIFLSGRSSDAARAVLADLGFNAHPLRLGEEIAVGDLCYRPLPATHDGGDDEWDVLPYVLFDTAGHGRLLSSVDVPVTDTLARAAADAAAAPGIWCVANNLTAPEHVPTQPGDTERMAAVLTRRAATLAPALGTTPAIAITGGGWSFPGERAWMNRRVFPVDNEDLAAALDPKIAGSEVLAPRPGDRIALERGRLVRPGPGPAPFVHALPRASWPERSLQPDATAHPIVAARPDDEVPTASALAERLEDFAAYLYGTPVFRSLCSALVDEVEGHHVAVGFVARYRGEAGREHECRLVHDPRRCGFVAVPADHPQARFVSGWEVWAADLAAFLDGRLAASGLCHAGRLRPFNLRPDVLRVSAHDLWMYGHPLRRPRATARLYAGLRADDGHGPPRIGAGTASVAVYAAPAR